MRERKDIRGICYTHVFFRPSTPFLSKGQCVSSFKWQRIVESSGFFFNANSLVLFHREGLVGGISSSWSSSNNRHLAKRTGSVGSLQNNWRKRAAMVYSGTDAAKRSTARALVKAIRRLTYVQPASCLVQQLRTIVRGKSQYPCRDLPELLPR